MSHQISSTTGGEGGGMSDDSSPKITALTPDQAARILSAAGRRKITEAMVDADIETGAPANADGTINLVHYAAWLVREAAHGD